MKSGLVFTDKEVAHRKGLSELYVTQLVDSGPFMTVVLKEAVRRLKESTIPAKKIEDWVVSLEKIWTKFL